MGSPPVIAKYELLSSLAGKMREAAEHGEWEQLIAIEQQCSELVVTIKALDAEVRLDDTERQYKRQLIQKILADHAEIQNLTQTWMEELQQSIQSNRQEQRLQQAYRP